MPKLENGTDKVYIDGKPYAKNWLTRDELTDSMRSMGVYWGGQPERLIVTADYEDWTNASDIPYGSFAALAADLDSFLFTLGAGSTNGETSDGNSTEETLSSGSTFVGDWELPNYPDAQIWVQAAGAATLFLEFSPDNGTTIDQFPFGGITLTPGIPYYGQVVIGRQYFRIRVQNDAGANNGIHTLVGYGDYGSRPASIINTGISGNSGAIATKAVIFGKDNNGSTYREAFINEGNAQVIADFGSEISLGNVPNYSIGVPGGRNSAIAVGTAPEDIWEAGGLYTGQPEGFTPETMEIVSTSGNDTAAGTGARTVVIEGLLTSSSSSYTTETITMNGTTPVTSSNSWYRIVKTYVATAGSGGENAGDITITSSGSGDDFDFMPAGLNESQSLVYTVPADQTLLLKRIRLAITRAAGNQGSANITLRTREPGGVYRARRSFEMNTGGPIEFTAIGGIQLAAGTDILFRVDSVSDNATIAEGAFEFILLADT